MRLKFILSFLFISLVTLSSYAGNADVAKDIFYSLFEFEGGTEYLRKVDDIQQRLKADGFTKSGAVPSKVDYYKDNDSHYKLKSTLTTFVKNGNKVLLNIPNSAKYKNAIEVKVRFADMATRNAFFKIAEANGIQPDVDSVGDDYIQYQGVYYMIECESNSLTVYINEFS